MINKNHHSATR